MNITTNKQLPLPTVESILEHIDSEQVFNMYLPNYTLGQGTIISPLRNDDTRPSFGVFLDKHTGNWLFKDFKLGTGNCFTFVKLLFKESFQDSLERIVIDFNLKNHFNVRANKNIVPTIKKGNPNKKVKITKGYKIEVYKRSWLKIDKEFWTQFGVTKATLEKFNVCPVHTIKVISGPYSCSYIKCENLAYAYEEYKDGKYSYKIYQPYSKNSKFRNNITPGAHFGYTQLPKEGDLLIITKSGKDVMSIHDVLGIPAISIQGESHKMKESVMDEYKSRFNKVIVFFDNDETGIKYSKKYVDYYKGIYRLEFTKEYPKDFSDMVKDFGKESAKNLLWKKLKAFL